MSIFGKLDATKVKTNQYYVEAGDYYGEILDADIKDKRDGSGRFLSIQMEIQDENSSFKGSKPIMTIDLPPEDLTEEIMATLPAEDQATIRRNNTKLKSTLCGNSRFPGLGIDENDLNDPGWHPKVLKGLKVEFTIRNFGTDGVQIAYVNLAQ